MSRYTPREIALLMVREIDPQESAPEDDEYIGEWEPEHSCGGAGDPTCAACWMHSYDAATKRADRTVRATPVGGDPSFGQKITIRTIRHEEEI